MLLSREIKEYGELFDDPSKPLQKLSSELRSKSELLKKPLLE